MTWFALLYLFSLAGVIWFVFLIRQLRETKWEDDYIPTEKYRNAKVSELVLTILVTTMFFYVMWTHFIWSEWIIFIACIAWLVVVIYQLRNLKNEREQVPLLKYRNAKMFELYNTLLVTATFIGVILDGYGIR